MNRGSERLHSKRLANGQVFVWLLVILLLLSLFPGTIAKASDCSDCETYLLGRALGNASTETGYLELGEHFLVSDHMTPDGDVIYYDGDNTAQDDPGSFILKLKETGKSFQFAEMVISPFEPSFRLKVLKVEAEYSNRPNETIIDYVHVDPPGETPTFGIDISGGYEISNLLKPGARTENITRLIFTWQLAATIPQNLNLETLTFKVANTNADLNGLMLSEGELTPGFLPTVTNYTATVASTVNNVIITPVPDDSKASVAVNGVDLSDEVKSAVVTLEVGENIIKIVVTAEDGTQKTYTVTLTRMANAVPIITGGDHSVIVAENTIGVLTTVTANDPEGDVLTYSLTGVDAGQFLINASGELMFLVPPDFEAPTDEDADNVYEVTVVVTDSGLASATHDVLVTVYDVNDVAPTIIVDGETDYAENGISPVLKVNFTDEDTVGTHTFFLTGVDHALFAIDSDGVLTFLTPPDYEAPQDANGNNLYELNVNVSDGDNSSTVVIMVMVTNINEAPIATEDVYHTVQNEPLHVRSDEGVLSNDTDEDEDDTLTAVLVSDPLHGSIDLNPNGAFIYTPNVDYYGMDSFSYKASDSELESNVVTATIFIHDVTPPEAPTIVLSEENWTNMDVRATIHGEAGSTVEYRLSMDAPWSVYTGDITLSAEGVHQLYARVIDPSDNISEEAQATVRIDKTAPIIHLHGEAVMTVDQGSLFLDPGYTVTDNLDSLPEVTIIGDVDTNTIGTYTIRYNASDTAGNQATERIRTMHVIPKPVGLSFDAAVYAMNERETTPFTVSINFSDGNQQEVTEWSAYSFEPEGIASITSHGFLYGLSSGSTVIEAVYGGQTAYATVTVRPIISKLQFDESHIELQAGETRSFALRAVYSDESMLDITDMAEYIISDPTVVQMNERGELTAIDAGTAVITASYASMQAELTVIVSAPELSNNAKLSDISLSAGTLMPDFTPDTKSYRATVPHAVREVTITAVAEHARATISIGKESATAGRQSVTVPVHVGSNNWDIIVTAEDGTVQAYKLDISRNAGGGNTSGVSYIPRPSKSDLVIIVNGEQQGQIGTVEKDLAPNGQSRIMVHLDPDKIRDLLQDKEKHATVVVQVSESSDQVVTRLDWSIVELMQSLQTELRIETQGASYYLPMHHLHLEQILDEPDAHIILEVTISVLAQDDIEQVDKHAKQAGIIQLVSPMNFTITAIEGDRSTIISKNGAYVTRIIAIPDSLDPDQVTTGAIVLPNGTFHHVPTKITEQDGSFFAEINSLTNSIYTLIHHEVSFDDVQHHWSEAIVNESASRLIVGGKYGQMFDPDSDVTRAEFTAMLIRALGISQATAQQSFQDVPQTAWYYDSVAMGEQYGLVHGYDDNSYRPLATVTREEAMVMMNRALKLAGLTVNLSDVQIHALLSRFHDGSDVSAWAQASVAACVDTKIVIGSNHQLSPQSNLTRAEAAAMIMRLLETAELI